MNHLFLFTIASVLLQFCKCQYQDDFLPKNVKPLRYNLTIEPKLQETNFSEYYGSLSIEIEILEDTNNITLHAKALKINNSLITLSDFNNNENVITNTSYDTIKNFFIITVSDGMKTGEKWIINFGFFSGLLTEPKAGYYVAKYKNESNKEKYLTVTELEPMHARQVFPCFDEPHFKARWIINLIRPNTSISASNTQIVSSTDLGDGRFIDTFYETKPMSTYLIAFVIAEFEYTKVNDRIRILVRPELVNYTEFMLTKSPKLLQAMEEYTGIPYALDKVDLVAIPDEFFLDGAMENWGLIVYAEKYLLCSNGTNLIDLQKCITFTAHEFAHQWFGNLATPKKWNYMWLSEGFSSFFQYYLADKVEPSWRLMEQYVLDEYWKALDNDIAPHTQPINFEFSDRDTFPSPYTYYSKASAVLRMTHHVLSDEVFRNGLKIYLKHNQFNSTEPHDLYNALDEALKQSNEKSFLENKTVTDFLEQWTTNIGHPIVTVTRDYKTGIVTFTQKTFRLDNSSDDNVWTIPITYMTSQSNVTDYLLTNASSTLSLNDLDGWILVNKDQIGFYRVNYDETNWKRLINFLHTDKFDLIPPVNRAQLISDALTYSRYGQLKYEMVFNLTTYLMQEVDYVPLRAFLTSLTAHPIDFIDNPDFKTFIRKILQVAYDRLGINEKLNETHIDKLNRVQILNWLCRYGDPVCQKTGLKIIQSGDFDNLPPNLQYPILCGGIQIANSTEWELLLEKYHSVTDIHEKGNYILALTCTREVNALIRLLDTLFDLDVPIAPNDRIKTLLFISKHSNIGLDTTLNYFVKYDNKNYERYSTAFSTNNELISVPESRLDQRNEDLLPNSVRPLRYVLTIEVLNDTHYRGNVLIEIEVLKNTTSVTLHAKELYINKTSIIVADETGGSISCRNVSTDKAKDFFTIHLDSTINEGEKYNVTINDFAGIMRQDKKGLFKADFENTNSNNSDLGNNRYQDEYEETPLISTYLVAFTISFSKYTKNNENIRILAPSLNVDDGSLDYILKESTNILHAFENYTDIPYTLPKLDLVSLPRKFAIDGAMENWGLITYSDKFLDCPTNSSSMQFQTCLTSSVHEFTHQWFGNLVTPKRWNYLWLSEGFGSYFQYHMADKINPTWRLKEQFVIEVLHSAFKNDLMMEQINYKFLDKHDFPNPVICYQKASSIIRMTSHVLTENVFQEALRIYLKNNKFKSTEPLDLYNAYESALKLADKEDVLENLTIHEILRTWNENIGYPIVTATRDYETGRILFTQKSAADYENVDDVLWHIPITYVVSSSKNYEFDDTSSNFWLSQRNSTLITDDVEGWFLVNKQAIGHYRVNYDETNWKRLIEFLKSKDFEKIPPLNRAQLINDAFHFVNQEVLNAELLFNLTMYLQQETDYIPILSFLKNVAIIGDNLKKFEDKKLFKMYLEKLLMGCYSKLGLFNKDTDTHVDRLLREETLPSICAINEDCQNFALTRLRKWKNSGVSLMSGETVFLCGAIKVGTLEDWEFLLNQYFDCTNEELRETYINALTCTQDQLTINRFLGEIFNVDNKMTPKDRTLFLNFISINSEVGKNSVLNYLLNIEDDTKYQNVFFEEEPVCLEVTSLEAKTYMPIIRKKVKTIKIAFLNGEDFDSDIAEMFLNWALKYFTDINN
ncbi:hypothetical protein FQR65_LT04957 [Abscondita terminalis]|nr:hypothetical protein FQR65_LT04957 [Abscondita terminalis]